MYFLLNIVIWNYVSLPEGTNQLVEDFVIKVILVHRSESSASNVSSLMTPGNVNRRRTSQNILPPKQRESYFYERRGSFFVIFLPF